jgi:Amt family ammonium transporter
LAYSWALGRRKKTELLNFRVSSVTLIYLGQFVLWFGWVGFNAGSAFGANLRAVVATWNTMLAGAFGSLTWCVIDYRLERKYTMVGLCFGSLAGLIAATPSSGFLPLWTSPLLGILAATICNLATKCTSPFLQIALIVVHKMNPPYSQSNGGN